MSTTKSLVGLALLSIRMGDAEEAGKFLAQANALEDCNDFLDEALSGVEGFVLSDVLASTSSSEEHADIEEIALSISKGADSVLRDRVYGSISYSESQFDSLSADEEDEDEDEDGDGFLDSHEEDDEEKEKEKSTSSVGNTGRSPLRLNL